jgi:hypothetical protein
MDADMPPPSAAAPAPAAAAQHFPDDPVYSEAVQTAYNNSRATYLHCSSRLAQELSAEDTFAALTTVPVMCALNRFVDAAIQYRTNLSRYLQVKDPNDTPLPGLEKVSAAFNTQGFEQLTGGGAAPKRGRK